MNLNLKTWYFSIVLLCIKDGLHGLRFEQLVRFSCDICAPDPEECCVGTVIHKDVILTTSYCATSCQSIHKYARRINIIRTYKQPRMEAKTRHDIALVTVNIDWKLRWTAQLSSVNIVSAIGLKAYYPFMDDGNTRMREIIVGTCGKRGQNVYGRHVCGIKTNSNSTTVKKCFQRQGVPLMLNGKVMAITAATNNKLCNDEQIVFNAIDTELSWINSTITELYPDDRMNEIEPHIVRSGNDAETSPTTMSSTTSTATSTTTFTTTTVITTTEESTTQESSTPSKTSDSTPSSTSDSTPSRTSDSTPSSTSDSTPTRTSDSTPSSTSDSTPSRTSDSMQIIPLNEDYNEYNGNEDMNPEPPLEVSGLPRRPGTEPTLSIFSTQTDAMDWFNQKVRSKMKSGNHSYFVLTTVKPVYHKTPFVDLTL